MDTRPTIDPAWVQAAQELLPVVRRALQAAVTTGRGPAPDDLPRHPPLDVPCGIFVTLKRRDRLRGCIGLPYPVLPMVEAAWQAAQQSALEDPRFVPVSDEELAGLEVTVSILTPHEPLAGIEDWVVGVDGAVLDHDGRRALYLPEVALETGWDAETFFANLAAKAGLPTDSWKDPATRLWRFRSVTAAGPAGLSERPGEAPQSPAAG
jgi:AmmeMemoRadiSam system protein A